VTKVNCSTSFRSTRSGWWAGDLAGLRQTNEKVFGIPVFLGMSDGPYTPGHLKEKLLGRVVGYAETALGGLLAPCAGRG
jgi:hypothetical protein